MSGSLFSSCILRKGQHGLSVALRYVLLLAAWAGPIPWCHRHAIADASYSLAEADSWLANHLRSFHGDLHLQALTCERTGKAAQDCNGWHTHFVFPGNSEQNPEKSIQLATDRIAPSDFGHKVIFEHSEDGFDGRFLTSLALFERIDFVSQPIALKRPVFHFFDAFAPSLSTPERFCVSRC